MHIKAVCDIHSKECAGAEELVHVEYLANRVIIWQVVSTAPCLHPGMFAFFWCQVDTALQESVAVTEKVKAFLPRPCPLLKSQPKPTEL